MRFAIFGCYSKPFFHGLRPRKGLELPVKATREIVTDYHAPDDGTWRRLVAYATMY
jgi:hypothetical protein